MKKLYWIIPFSIVFFLTVFSFWAKSNKVLSPASEKLSLVSEITKIAEPQPKPISIMLGGDVMLGRWVEASMRQKNDWQLAMAGLASKTTTADFFMVNLEAPFLDNTATTPIDSLILHADPRGVESLRVAGVDVAILANNHIPDKGLLALQKTTSVLSEGGIKYLGAGEDQTAASSPLILEIGNNKIGILSYTYGTNIKSSGVYVNQVEVDNLARDIAAIKDKTDLIFVSMHAGTEYATYPSSSQINFAHKAIELGASIVFGHHPHVVQKMEKFQNGYIFYSLGNLVFDQAANGPKTLGAIVNLKIENKQVKDFEILPVSIKNYYQTQFSDGQEKEFVLEAMTR